MKPKTHKSIAFFAKKNMLFCEWVSERERAAQMYGDLYIYIGKYLSSKISFQYYIYYIKDFFPHLRIYKKFFEFEKAFFYEIFK